MRRLLLSSVATLAVIASVACSSDPAASNASTPAPDGGTPEGGEADTGGTISLKVNVTSETLDVGGRQRSYTLAVPKTYDDQRQVALVLVFHGDGGDGASMRKAYTFDDASGEEAIVAYPSGTDRGWNLYTPLATNDDMKFIEALVESLSAKFKVDASRVFAAGYSSGGFFINQLACRKTGFFRGLVSFAGGAPDEPEDPSASMWPSGATKCNGQTGGIAAMIVHGDADGAVGPDSGDYNAQYWAGINGCQETRVDTTPAPCQKYEGCPTDKPVLFCLIPKLGHVVWSQGATEGWAFMKSL